MLNNFFKKPYFKSIDLKASIKMNLVDDDEMALSEHIEEFSQRLVFCLVFLILSTLLCFADVKEIVRIFQAPAIGVKFLQFAPGEYFFASVKIALFSGLLLASPLIIYQLLLYLLHLLLFLLRLCLSLFSHRNPPWHT